MSPSTPTQASTKNTPDVAPVGINELLCRLASTCFTTQDNPPLATYEDRLGMSATELRTALTMCGLTTDQEDVLPEWKRERGMTTNIEIKLSSRNYRK